MARILLVEDDPDVKLLLEHVLQSAGYEVKAVETATHARPLIDVQPFDLLLTDGTLVDGTGVELADRAAARGLRAVIVTGNALALPSEGLARHELLLKPLRPAELLSAIERILAKPVPDRHVVPLRR